MQGNFAAKTGDAFVRWSFYCESAGGYANSARTRRTIKPTNFNAIKITTTP
jgi:hypothetical protein